MDQLEPNEIIEQLDYIIESLTSIGNAYSALDLAYELREEIIEELEIDSDEE